MSYRRTPAHTARSFVTWLRPRLALGCMLVLMLGLIATVGSIPYYLAGSPGPPPLELPWMQVQDFVVMRDGGIVIGLDPISRVQQYDASGRFVRSAGWDDGWRLENLAVAEDGRLFVVLSASGGNVQVDVLDETLQRIGTVSAPGLLTGIYEGPPARRQRLALDHRGVVRVVATEAPVVRGRPVRAGEAFGPALRAHRHRAFTAADGTRAWRSVLVAVRSVRQDGSRVTTHPSSWILLLSAPLFLLAAIPALLLAGGMRTTHDISREHATSAPGVAAMGIAAVVWLVGALAIHALLVMRGWHAAWLELPAQVPWFAATAWCAARLPAWWHRSSVARERR